MDPGENLGHADVSYGAVNKKHAEEINSSQSALCRTLGTKAFSHLAERGVFFLYGGKSMKWYLFLLRHDSMRIEKYFIVDNMQPAGRTKQAGCLFRQIAGTLLKNKNREWAWFKNELTTF
jgi:hypothetical protein